jgi:D-beta-D-heptose 7-phosphate kinase/D-beta-D-heptose 1-phosphate adenosyltransferase
MRISADRARVLLEAARSKRILVVGDLMWDRYIYGTVDRISPEAPVPVLTVTKERHMPGGASNVAWNVQTLGGQAAVCGVMGCDSAADELQAFFREQGIDAEAAVSFEDARTTVKMRIVAETQQVVRVDWDDRAALDDAAMERFLGVVVAEVEKADGVIIEDYGKGVVSQGVADAVLRTAQARGIPVGYDPKDDHPLRVSGVTVATPNRHEAYHAVGRHEGPPGEDPLKDEALLQVGRLLLDQWEPEVLLMTLGPQGMLLLDREGRPRHAPTRAREVYDVSGAGDTVIATLVLALAGGANAEEAADLANYAAGVVVGHVGTATCAPDELLASIEQA